MFDGKEFFTIYDYVDAYHHFADRESIVAELVNNAVRHAHSQQVQVHLRCHPSALEMCVEDDGRGFSWSENTHATGIGLRGVRTRAAYLGGSVVIETPAAGTRIVVRLPY